MMDLLSSAACNVHIFPQVVQSVFKRVDGRRVHDMLREFIPGVDHSLAEKVYSDIQVWSIFSDCAHGLVVHSCYLLVGKNCSLSILSLPVIIL